MSKYQSLAYLCLSLSFDLMACGGDVSMSIPHIHNEDELIDVSKGSSKQSLKQIDIYQIFAGELEQPEHAHSSDKHALVHSKAS
ncbi:hypothetical protein [Alginatibacterium sediminis]|uniref:hypothetical protein n=1 Tax=Alginatibacterium sediminis TaxID=2164068 RepID=UPI0018F2D2E8|nr:hypothetical protein [Alginatibacterium sediminis]